MHHITSGIAPGGVQSFKRILKKRPGNQTDHYGQMRGKRSVGAQGMACGKDWI